MSRHMYQLLNTEAPPCSILGYSFLLTLDSLGNFTTASFLLLQLPAHRQMTHMFVSTDQNFALRPIHLAASITSPLRWFPEISANEIDLQKNLCFSLSTHPLSTNPTFQCSLSHVVSLNWWHLHLSCSISQKPSSHQWHIPHSFTLISSLSGSPNHHPTCKI